MLAILPFVNITSNRYFSNVKLVSSLQDKTRGKKNYENEDCSAIFALKFSPNQRENAQKLL